MPVRWLIRAGEYHDSVPLMQVAREVTRQAGVADAAVVMATEANKALLRQAGLWQPKLEKTTADDLVIVVQAHSEAVAHEALELAAAQLKQPPRGTRADPAICPRSIRTAVRADPQSDLAIISVAGQYAAAEAWEALRHGLHVFLFSDTVSIDDEVALKEYATEHQGHLDGMKEDDHDTVGRLVVFAGAAAASGREPMQEGPRARLVATST